MEQYVIRGGNPLVGEVEIGGAKNAALAILTAATMTDETVLIENLPDVSDINVLLEAIAEIGATVDRIDRHTVRINASTIGDLSVDYEYIKKIRASYYLLGALLGKQKSGSSAAGRMQHRKPSDRPAFKRIPRTRCRSQYPSRCNYGERIGSARQPHFHGYGFRRSNHQCDDGSVYGKRKHND